MALTTIQDRLTPSVPIQLTFGAGVITFGKKLTTLFGHFASVAGTGMPYQVYTVVNVGDPAAAQAEVDLVAGSGSQAGKMAFAFVNANVLGGFGNFPGFRLCLIPYGVTNFGPNSEAITAVKFLRSDKFVSCFPASDATNAGTLLALTTLISGNDRDLQGQFGSFMVLGSLDALAVATQYAFNSRFIEVAYLPDSNTAAVPVLGTVTSGSPIVTAVSQAPLTVSGNTTTGTTTVTGITSTAGIYVGAAITGTGIPANTVVESVTPTTLILSANATATNAAESLSVTNLPVAGVNVGAQVTGTGIPALTTVLSVSGTTITLSNNATATGAAETIAVQNVVSQAPEVVAAAYAGGQMGSVFPYVPMQNVVCGGLVPPRKVSDWVALDPNGASEQALAAGLAPMFVQPGGTVGYVRTRTTYTMNGVLAVTAYFDWQDLVTMNDFREVCYAVTQNPPFNNNPGGTKASLGVAALLKDEILREAQSFEDQGAFQGVKTLAPLFLVQNSTTSRGRFDFQIPVNVIPGLFVIAGNIVGVAGVDFGDFTL